MTINLPLLATTMCADVNSFTDIGLCIFQASFLNDPILLTIGLILVWTTVLFAFRSMSLSISTGLGFIYILAIMFPSPILTALLVLMIAAVAVVIARGVLKFAKR